MTRRRWAAILLLVLVLFGCSTRLSAFRFDPADRDTASAALTACQAATPWVWTVRLGFVYYGYLPVPFLLPLLVENTPVVAACMQARGFDYAPELLETEAPTDDRGER